MRAWTAEQIARAAGARLIAALPGANGPERVVIDSREAGRGALFVGLKGQSVDGGRFARQALQAGAWGTLTTAAHAADAADAAPADAADAASADAADVAPADAADAAAGVVLAAGDPLAALQRLATAWRRELGAEVIGVTGSTGKTSTKDLLLAVLAPHRRTVASRSNYNTEIGLPLEILAAPMGTEVLVLEMAMRGAGQIAELAAIAEPGVGVIVSVGPVHLELLGTIEAIAAAKAELIAALPAGGTAVVPAGEVLLEPHLREDLRILSFGEGGDVQLASAGEDRVEIALGQERISLAVPFTQAHLRRNLLAAVAAAHAIGVRPEGRVGLALSAGRGQRISLPGSVTLIDDCYNANPVSMRAALDDLASATLPTSADGVAPAPGSPSQSRLVAVLGDMLELGPREREFHVAIGRHAADVGVDLLVTVGPLGAAIGDGFDRELYRTGDASEAAALVPDLLRPGDLVLVKGSRGVALELVCRALGAPKVA